MDLSEVFDYAIDQEIKAMEFYERSAAQVENVEAASLFRSLARMEAAHRRALENEKSVLADLGELPRKQHPATSAEEEAVESWRRIAGVLKEANVELTSRHKRMAAELEAAGHIQESLLPKTAPQLPGLTISVSCSMAARVGGDFYDFLITPRGHLALTIADVSGKGLPAALTMMAIRTLWRSKIREDESPAQVLSHLSAEATPELHLSDQFVTLITAAYDLGDHQLTFANAGHWPPLVCLAGEEHFMPIPSGWLPIGFDESEDYQAHSLDLHPGSLVVFYSDGIIDARNPEGERFGEARFRELVFDAKDKSGDDIRDLVTTTVFEFCRGRQDDDQTLMIIKRV